MLLTGSNTNPVILRVFLTVTDNRLVLPSFHYKRLGAFTK